MAGESTPADREQITMKPMLGALIQEAVKLALIDVAEVPLEAGWHERPRDYTRLSKKTRAPTDEERAQWREDVYAIPATDFDPMALAQNVAVRLLGPGGWMVNGVYGGNASAQELLDASFERPCHAHVDDVAFDLRAVDDEEG